MKMDIFILSAILWYYIGYVSAHYTIASECKKLGGFFVGKETFKCIKVEVSPTLAKHEGEQ